MLACVVLVLALAAAVAARTCPECVLPIVLRRGTSCRLDAARCQATLLADTSEAFVAPADSAWNFLYPRPSNTALPSHFAANSTTSITFTWPCDDTAPMWVLSNERFVAALEAEASSESCEQALRFERGTAPLLLFRDCVVMAPGGALDNGSLLVDLQTREIACVGELALCEPLAQNASVIYAPGSILSAGLINAHDHLPWNWNAPVQPSVVYTNRYQWMSGYDGSPVVPARSLNTAQSLVWAELRHLLAGTTSTVDSTGVAGLLRNLDRQDIAGPGVSANIRYRTNAYNARPPELTAESECSEFDFFSDDFLFGDGGLLVTHLGEGTDDLIKREIACSIERGLASPNSSWVHALALSLEQCVLFGNVGTSVLWSPRTDRSFYNAAPPLAALRAVNVPVAITTDWTVSGSIDLLRELRCAKSVAGELYEDAELLAMCTEVPARMMRVEAYVGSLRAGLQADLALYAAPGIGASDAASFLVNAATTRDVLLTMVAGEALYGDAALMQALQAEATLQPMLVCGADKALLWQNTTWGVFEATLGELEASLRAQTEGCPTCLADAQAAGLSTTCADCLSRPELATEIFSTAFNVCIQEDACTSDESVLVVNVPTCTTCYEQSLTLVGLGAPLYPLTFPCDAPPPGEPTC